jgi:hypothetical protein
MLDCLSAMFGNVQLRAKKKKRKLALFGVACCRHIPRLCNEKPSTIAIEVAERYADGMAKINEVRIANRNAGPPAGDYSHFGRVALGRYLAEHAVLANATCNAVLVSEYALQAATDRVTERSRQCDLLRDIFGNPFQRVGVSKGWLTPTVKQLAEVIYDERSFNTLPILGDALEDAGCNDTAIFEHCRQPGSHVRGCWVVDLILSKK